MYGYAEELEIRGSLFFSNFASPPKTFCGAAARNLKQPKKICHLFGQNESWFFKFF
jgi:hypothetical protein